MRMITFLKQQLSFRSRAQQITMLMVVLSIVQAVLSNAGMLTLFFMPLRTVFHLEIWRPLTSLFISASPLEVVFGGMIIYSIGGALESRAGEKRFLSIALGIPLVAHLLTIPAFLFFSNMPDTLYPGARSVVTAIWIAFGLIASFSGQMLQFWGTPVSGRTFALFGLGFVVLSAVFGGLVGVLPELIAAGLTYAYLLRRGSFDIKRRVELMYYNWKLRRLKAKKGFRVVRGSKEDSDDSSHQIH
jgi:membrane associated rhomboid family serine protease